MKLPIYGYGMPVLKKVAEPITKDYHDLNTLIENMWETMYHAEGVGLAAPQIGLSIRLFLVDTTPVVDKKEGEKAIKKVFINAELLHEEGDEWSYEEGCLSIPTIRGDVDRPEKITLKYLDTDFVEYTETFDGINARVIQHEYDHIDGILFTELLKPVKKALIRKKLDNVRKGNVKIDYGMKFVSSK